MRSPTSENAPCVDRKADQLGKCSQRPANVSMPIIEDRGSRIEWTLLMVRSGMP